MASWRHLFHAAANLYAALKSDHVQDASWYLMDEIDFSLVGYGYHHYVFANHHPRLSFSSEQTDTDLLSLAVDRLESNEEHKPYETVVIKTQLKERESTK